MVKSNQFVAAVENTHLLRVAAHKNIMTVIWLYSTTKTIHLILDCLKAKLKKPYYCEMAQIHRILRALQIKLHRV